MRDNAGNLLATIQPDSGVTSTYTYAGTNSNEVLKEATAGGHTYGLVYGRPDQSGLPESSRSTTTRSPGTSSTTPPPAAR